jgi:predicted HTH domain antitoxin
VIYWRLEDAMPVVISDETLQAAGLSEQDAKTEIACRWFDAAKLSFGQAALFAGLSKIEFERELFERGIPRIRYTEEKLENDIEVLKKLGRW